MLEQEDDKDERWDRPNPHFPSASQLMLGLERESKTSDGFESDRISVVLDARVTTKIDRLSSTHHVSSEVFLLACWQILVWRLTGCKDLTIDYLCEGRRIRGLQEAVGAFTRFCPIQSHLEPDYQFTETLELVDQLIKSAQARLNHLLRQDCRVMEDGRPADRVHAIGFEYEEWPAAESAGSVEFRYWKQSVCIDRFKLKLAGYRKADGLTIEIQYDPAIFTRESVELIRERYLKLIESAVEREQAPIEDLEIVGRRELERLVEDWNRTKKRLTAGRCIHELIAEQARLRPEAIAVVYQDEQLTYRGLERRANQLANHLQELGVGPECVVGLYLERSTEMMIGWLGILKAGGAYLPLEVGQPEERLGRMLKDAGVEIVVTRQEVAGSLPGEGLELVMLDVDREGLAR